MTPERSHLTVIFIGEVLDIVQLAATGVEPRDIIYPAWLCFVAVAEVNVYVIAGFYIVNQSINQSLSVHLYV